MLERVSDGVRLAELDESYTDLNADRLASPMSAPEGALTTLVLTMDHPMHHATRGWVHAGELAAGDRLTGDEPGETFRVVSADFTAARTLGAAPSLTYNLTVADTHTYFVGEDGVLVHNGKTDRTFGLPKRFWNWYHRNYKRPGDGDLFSYEEARDLYDEW